MTSSPLSKPEVALESQAPTQHTRLQTEKDAELPREQTPAPAQSIPFLLPFARGSSWQGDFGGHRGCPQHKERRGHGGEQVQRAA